jgi:hypothetical protein
MLPLILVSPLAFFSNQRRPFIFCAVQALLFLALASAGHTPARLLYEAVPRLYDFRWSSREIALALPFVAILAGLGLDGLWLTLNRVRERATMPEPGWRALKAAMFVAGGVYLCLAVGDLYRSNQDLYSFGTPEPARQAVAKVLESDSDWPFLFQHFDGAWGIPVPYRESGLKKLDATWAWRVRREPSLVVEDRGPMVLSPMPRYLVLRSPNTPANNATHVATVSGASIFRLEGAPHYASFIRSSEADEHPERFQAGPANGWPQWPFQEVTAASASWPTTNSVRVEGAPAPGQETLMVLETYVPGWRLEVDGEAAGAVQNLGGFLSAPALSGHHRYTFVFDPAYVWRGFAVSAVTLVIAVAFLSWTPVVRTVRRLRVRRHSPKGAAP